MITGYWLSQPIYCAAKLGLADLLKDSSKSSTELASLTGVHAQSLFGCWPASEIGALPNRERPVKRTAASMPADGSPGVDAGVCHHDGRGVAVAAMG